MTILKRGYQPDTLALGGEAAEKRYGGTHMGTVRIKYFGYLAEKLGREREVEVEEEARILDIIELPAGTNPDNLVYLINGLPAKPDSKVKPGDVISVLPHVSGGM